MRVSLFSVLVASSLVVAMPAPRDDPPPDPVHINEWFPEPFALSDCPGYAASNVVKTDSSLTADLTLAGTACNVYSDDLKDLKLLVEYQTSESRLSISKHWPPSIPCARFYPKYILTQL